MKVTVKGKEYEVARIVDLVKQKKIRVFIPGLNQGPLELEGADYGTGLVSKSANKFKELIESKLNA